MCLQSTLSDKMQSIFLTLFRKVTLENTCTTEQLKYFKQGHDFAGDCF